MENPKAEILVVDDDASLLSLLVDTLTAIGYKATGVNGGIRALEALAESAYDLLITDIKMPDLDGVQLLERVRGLYANLPVLFITGVSLPETFAQASPDGVLMKPFRISHIEELIEKTLTEAAVSN
jgi:DNA-binding NtrC family response regulator